MRKLKSLFALLLVAIVLLPLPSAAWNKINNNGTVMLGGLSLVDRGRAPQYTSTGTTFRQFTNSDPLHHALQRAKQVGIVELNAGVAGSTSADTLSNLSVDVLSAVPFPGTYCYQQGGNNVNLVTGFSNLESTLSTFASETTSIYQSIIGAGINFCWRILPDNGTWTSDAVSSVLSSQAQQSYARSFSYWRMRRWQMEFARLTGSKYINEAAGYTRDARQLPLAVTSNTISSTTTTAQFTAPASGQTVTITMTSTAAFAASDFITIATAGVYQVSSVTDGTHLVGTNYPIAGNAAGGVVIATSKNVTMGTVTTTGNHGYSNGNLVVNTRIAPIQQLVVSPLPVHVTGNTTFTYPAPATNTPITTQGTFQRTGVLEQLTADQTIHYNPKGAVKLSYAAEEGWVWNARDYMPESNNDSENLIGVGLSATDKDVMSIGMMTQGTGGSFSGPSSSSGTVPTGFTLTKIGGGGSDTVAGSVVAFTDPGRNQMSYQQFSVTTGTSDGHYGFTSAMTKPTAFQASNGYSLNNWVSPTTANGYYYIVVVAGTSGTEPTWSTTPGQTTVSGGATFETRRAPFFDGTTKYHFVADMQCVSGCTALISVSCGLFDDTNGYYITDGDDVDNSLNPQYLDGDHRYLMTPDVVLNASTTTLNAGCRFWTDASTTVVVNFGRLGLYRSGFGQNSMGAI